MNETTPGPVGAAYTDVYLGVLLRFLDRAEAKGSSVSVSLLVGGTSVCGELISHDDWLSELQQWMHDIGGNGELLGTLFETVDEKFEPGPPDGGPLHFVHLKNARVVTNYRGTLSEDVAQGVDHRLWRGRLLDVQGWTLGRPA